MKAELGTGVNVSAFIPMETYRAGVSGARVNGDLASQWAIAESVFGYDGLNKC